MLEEQQVLSENLNTEAIRLAEQTGIVVIDEIDKICTASDSYKSADASAEGVQRDLLPLIEGCITHTKYGNVRTDHILFVAAGAFHRVKPSDLLPELQGRLPIRVELEGNFIFIILVFSFNLNFLILLIYYLISFLFFSFLFFLCIIIALDEAALYKVITEPENSLIKQQIALIGA